MILPTEEVWSGGQTGADLGGLVGARAVGYMTGGWAAKGWQTERGPQPSLASFNLRECPDPGYPARTRYNVRDTDGTLLVGDRTSVGSRLTLDLCRQMGRPHLVVGWTPERGQSPSAAAIEAVRAWLVRHRIRRLNVAGNRESVAPGIEGATAWLVREVLRVDTLRTTVESHPTVQALVRALAGTVEEVVDAASSPY